MRPGHFVQWMGSQILWYIQKSYPKPDWRAENIEIEILYLFRDRAIHNKDFQREMLEKM